MFIDSHAHLEGPRFDSDRGEVIRRASEAGVRNILAVGTGEGPGTLDCAVRLSEQFGLVYATIGIHPHEAKLAKDSDFQELEQLAQSPKVIAWGEIGLDYFYDHSPRETQKLVFTRQMELAALVRLPIVIHCRPSQKGDDAWQDCLGLIEEHWRRTGLAGILHCFTGSWPCARRALDMGFLISFAGNVSFPKAQQLRQCASQVPLECMLIETDSPYLAPLPYRGKRNEPAYVVQVARAIAELRGVPHEQVGNQTADNFYRFFSLPKG